MEQNKTMFGSAKLIFFLFFFWLIGVLLAIFWGLGWFFLLESLRRLVTYIPPLDHKIRVILLGKEQVERDSQHSISISPGMVTISKLIRVLILVVWAGITIFVFLRINIPLIVLFNHVIR